jgi:hypothetical protein
MFFICTEYLLEISGMRTRRLSYNYIFEKLEFFMILQNTSVCSTRIIPLYFTNLKVLLVRPSMLYSDKWGVRSENVVTIYSAFGKSLCTYKRCWKWCPRTIASKDWIKQLTHFTGNALQPLFNNWIQWNNSTLQRQLRYWQPNLRILT